MLKRVKYYSILLPQYTCTCTCISIHTTIFYSSKSMSDIYETMNNELKILSDWFRANKLSVNASKTNYMMFTKHTNCNIGQMYYIFMMNC